MVRPTNKTELMKLGAENYQKLNDLIDTIPAEKQMEPFPFEDRDKNIRDVVVHLHEWHKMMLEWYRIGMSDGKPVIPAEGYTWKMTPELNAAIWKKYQGTSLREARELLDETHQKEMRMIEGHSNEELFTKKYFKWTNTTSLGSYFISSTSSHYDWANKKIKKFKKAAGV